jgi:hypothetical protein
MAENGPNLLAYSPAGRNGKNAKTLVGGFAIR